MAWWQASDPDVVVAPSGELRVDSIRDRRFVDRGLVQPGPCGRMLWGRLAEVLAAVGDLRPLSLYETSAEDVTAIVGPSVHAYFRPEGDVLVESVDPEGWRRFTFHPQTRVMARVVMGLATIAPTAPDRVMACTLVDGRGGVLISDGDRLVLGDLPEERGPVRSAVRLSPEDVQLLLLARLRVPAVA